MTQTAITTYANALKADMLDAGLTQEELARKVDTKQQTVSGWLRGLSVPRPVYHDKLVAALGRHCRIAAIPKRGEFRVLLEAKHGNVEVDEVHDAEQLRCSRRDDEMHDADPARHSRRDDVTHVPAHSSVDWLLGQISDPLLRAKVANKASTIVLEALNDIDAPTASQDQCVSPGTSGAKRR